MTSALWQCLYLTTALTVTSPALAQTLVFDEEFNSSSLSQQWQMGYSWAPGGYKVGSSFWPGANSSGISPAQFNDHGIMSLVVASGQGNTHGQPYLAGIVTTKASFSRTYGYYAARIRMPQTPGLMGAFWLLPVNGDWPPEVDITEVLAASPTTNVMTVHTTDGNGPSVHSAHSATANVPNTSADFHIYAVDWQADHITWYFDDQQVHSESTPPDLHQPAYILLDSLAGNPGDWEGGPSGPVLDAMQVDWVRVWDQKPVSDAIDGTIPTATVIAKGNASISTTNVVSNASTNSGVAPIRAEQSRQNVKANSIAVRTLPGVGPKSGLATGGQSAPQATVSQAAESSDLASVLAEQEAQNRTNTALADQIVTTGQLTAAGSKPIAQQSAEETQAMLSEAAQQGAQIQPPVASDTQATLARIEKEMAQVHSQISDLSATPPAESSNSAPSIPPMDQIATIQAEQMTLEQQIKDLQDEATKPPTNPLKRRWHHNREDHDADDD